MKQTVKLLSAPRTEADHQINVIRWSQIHRGEYPELALLFHVPNGGSRDVREATHLKQMGVKPGVPDLFLPVARGSWHGLWIEMKALNGRISQAQDQWIHELARQGYRAVVCYGWEDAVGTLTGYLREG